MIPAGQNRQKSSSLYKMLFVFVKEGNKFANVSTKKILFDFFSQVLINLIPEEGVQGQ